MAFDLKAFNAAKLEPRTEDVPVPDLAVFFAAPDKPVWKIRQLTGEELSRANEAAGRNKQASAILRAMAASETKSDAIKELMGFSDAIPEDLAKRIEHLMLGSVEPKVDRETALRLFRHYPVVAWQLCDRILALTGKGAVSGEPKRSTRAGKSKPSSGSATSKGDSSTKPDQT